MKSSDLKKKAGGYVLALVLAPVYVVTHDMEFNASVVSNEEEVDQRSRPRRRKDGSIGKSTKGIDNAKEGSNVTIKNT